MTPHQYVGATKDGLESFQSGSLAAVMRDDISSLFHFILKCSYKCFFTAEHPEILKPLLCIKYDPGEGLG